MATRAFHQLAVSKAAGRRLWIVWGDIGGKDRGKKIGPVICHNVRTPVSHCAVSACITNTEDSALAKQVLQSSCKVSLREAFATSSSMLIATMPKNDAVALEYAAPPLTHSPYTARSAAMPGLVHTDPITPPKTLSSISPRWSKPRRFSVALEPSFLGSHMPSTASTPCSCCA